MEAIDGCSQCKSSDVWMPVHFFNLFESHVDKQELWRNSFDIFTGPPFGFHWQIPEGYLVVLPRSHKCSVVVRWPFNRCNWTLVMLETSDWLSILDEWKFGCRVKLAAYLDILQRPDLQLSVIRPSDQKRIVSIPRNDVYIWVMSVFHGADTCLFGRCSNIPQPNRLIDGGRDKQRFVGIRPLKLTW